MRKKKLSLTILLTALMLTFGAAAAMAYTVDDHINKDEDLKFNWTKDGKPFTGQWKYYHKCDGDAGWTEAHMFPGLTLEYRNMNPGSNGKACEFKFVAPAGATDWRQVIIGKDGSSDVYGGNVKKNSPWRFESLESLPQVHTRIPDLAPVAGNPEETIYTAVNLELYMTKNPHGFLNGNWEPGNSLEELGVVIVDGQVEGIVGIYWSVSPFEFDSDPDGPGFVPSGGQSDLLNSEDYPYALVVQQQHEDVASTADQASVATVTDN